MFFYLFKLKNLLRDELYVMLMLMRSETNAVDCDDPVVALACLDEEADAYKECPAACREDASDNTNEDGEVVKSGDLAVTASPASERKAIIGQVSDLDTLKFKTSEEVTISKIVLERYGYSKGADVDKVWLEDEDGNEITARKGVNSRDQVELTFKKDYKVVDGAINATVVVKLNDPVTTGGTIGFKVISAESTAENQELNLDGYTPYTYDMVGYDAVNVSIDAKGNDKDYNYEEGEMYEVAKFKLKAKTSPLMVNGVNLKNVYDGDKLDLKDFLDKVEVLMNGEKVDGVKFTINKKDELNISFDSVEVAAKENATFTVNISLAGFDKYGQGVKFAVAKDSDVKIQEKKTGARVSVTLPTDTPESDDIWAKHKFVGSKIKLTNTKLGNIEYAQGSSEVVVAEGTIAISESVELVDNKFTVTATYDTGYDIIDEMRLVIAGEEIGDVEKTYTAGSKTATFKFSDVVIEKGGKFQIRVDLDRDAPEGAKVTFEPAFDEAAFSGATYPDADDSKVSEDEISGTISFASRLTIQASKASLTNTLTKEQSFKDNETSESTKVFEGVYTAKKGTINLTDFEIEAVDTALDLGTSNIEFELLVNGKSVSDIKLKGTTISGSDSFGNIKVEAGETADVVVNAVVTAKNLVASGQTENILGKFKVTLRGEDEEGNPAGEAYRNTVSIKVEKAGSIILGDANTSKENTVLLRGTDDVLADFNVESENGSKTELETLVFTLSGITLSSINDIKVEVNDSAVTDDDYCVLDTATVTCSGMAETVNPKANIKVLLDNADDATGKIELTVTTINNDTNVNKTFKKSFVDALVTFTKQDFSDRYETEFSISVDKYTSNKEASNIIIYAGDACEPIYTGSEVLTNSKKITIKNKDESQEICKVVYSIKDQADVTIEKSVYSDYFKDIPTEGANKAKMSLMVRDNKAD